MIIIISHPQEERALSSAYAVWAFGGLGRCWHGLRWAVQTREEDHRSSALLLRNQIPSDESNTVCLLFPQLQTGNQHLGSSLQPFSLGGCCWLPGATRLPPVLCLFLLTASVGLSGKLGGLPMTCALPVARFLPPVLGGGDRCGQRG